MDLYTTFTLIAEASIVLYVEGNVFDNNFVLTEEYDKWSAETFNSDTPWVTFTNEDISIENMNYMIASCCDYSYDFGMDMPYTVDGLLWMYGLAMEQEMREDLHEKFNSMMLNKQMMLSNENNY
jgi:hypothetical protein